MRELIIGCVTYVPEMSNLYFNLDMKVHEGYTPTMEQREELKNFLQPHFVDIIDDVVYIIDVETMKLIWEIETDEN